MQNKRVIDEMFDLIKEYNDGDAKGTIEFAVEILNAIRNNPKQFTNDFDNRIEEYARQYDRCCCCGEELIVNTYGQESEYQGCLVEEPVYERECPNCGCLDY